MLQLSPIIILDRRLAIIFILIILGSFGVIFYLINKPPIKQKTCPTYPAEKIKRRTINLTSPLNNFNTIMRNPEIDPISTYDYDKVFDPLTFPNRRVQRWELPPPHLKSMIDIHTQGYPDTFRQIGILTSEKSNSIDNKILRLYGRELYPRSGRYEYYTEISDGNNSIKIPITTKRGGDKELFDNDNIFISELSTEYKIF
jgi:hypothetical protein